MKDGIPSEDITREEAIKILKDLLVQNPLMYITTLGKAIMLGIKAMEEKNE